MCVNEKNSRKITAKSLHQKYIYQCFNMYNNTSVQTDAKNECEWIFHCAIRKAKKKTKNVKYDETVVYCSDKTCCEYNNNA